MYREFPFILKSCYIFKVKRKNIYKWNWPHVRFDRISRDNLGVFAKITRGNNNRQKSISKLISDN